MADVHEIDEDDCNTDNSNIMKQTVPGVIYISFLPPRMTPLHLRQIFEKYGEVGRIFLQPDERKVTKKKGRPKYNKGSFTEGWIEMGDKKVAKKIALTFHNTLMEDGKKSKFSDYTWNLKYLHRFRWGHLTERLAHEREVRKQKMRVEQSQARRETAAFVANIDAGKRLKSIKERREKRGDVWQEKRNPRKIKQRKTVEEMRLEKLHKLNEIPLEKDVTSQDFKNTSNKAIDSKKVVLSKIFGS
ncbi:activator of basal transcription 1-like [Clavelina lepadiformis]|uniref:Activator of basal transcription 1 n=1 Tax=Clavelina lepadiformis TaxID=159417 RepID=A0ABP0GHX3_CLALP